MTSTSTLATRRRQETDASRRVTFSENTNSSRLYDYSEDEDEEEQERALSELHGEAEEGVDRKRKKEETDKDIAQELEQEVKKKIRKPRPQLGPSHLTSAEGLIRLPVEMKQIKYKPKKGKKRDVLAAAAYSKKLINAYQLFCDDLFPSLAFEDVLLKIEQLGSKKEVKTFVQHMRDDVRNKHLERLYGREKAEQMLLEVDEHMKQQENTEEENSTEVQQTLDGEDSPTAEQESNTLQGSPSPTSDGRASSRETEATSVVTPTETRAPSDVVARNQNEDDDEENEAVFEEDDFLADAAEQSESIHQSEVSSPKDTRELTAPAKSSRLRIQDSDDEDEEEATFDDISAAVSSDKDATIPAKDDKETLDDGAQQEGPQRKMVVEEPDGEGSLLGQNNEQKEDGHGAS